MKYLLAILATSLAAEDFSHFESRVRPVLASKCQSCHGADKQFAALRLDSREAILQGGQHGPAALPGQPEASLLIKAIKHLGPQMPLGSKLADAEIAAFEEWIRVGLPWPASGKAAPSGLYDKLLREHWAYQPVRRSALPPGKTTNPIDRFLPATASLADKRVLARRAAYVVTGLLPRPEWLAAYLSDPSPKAYENYLDTLLASPRYGERWARHWMDVVRYAETYGYEWNYEIQGAWQYRDYLIRSLNLDLPYNQFVREHIAGDLLPAPRFVNGNNESILATAFYRLGEMGHDNCDQFREIRTDVVDNQIDTLSKAFQGVTVSCARCHDHKIDPIPTEDYYALYGILNSSRPVARTVTRPATISPITELKAAIRAELASAWLKDTASIARELQAALAARQDASNAADLAQGLDPARIDRWRKLLDRDGIDLSDPLSVFTTSFNYAKESEERRAYNQKHFTTAADFTQGMPAGWSIDGLGLPGISRAGDFAVATEGSEAVTGIYPAGLFTHLVTDRWNGTLRSPLLPSSKKYASFQILGGKFAARRSIVDNCVIGEGNNLLDHRDLRWDRVSTKEAGKFPVYLEVNTKTDNPRLPERPGKFKQVIDEGPRSYFGVTRIVYHDEELTPKATLDHLQALAANPTPERFAAQVSEALIAWQNGSPTPDQVTWLTWLLDQGILVNSRNLTPQLRELTSQFRAAEAQLPAPTVIASMGDFDPGRDHPIFLAGAATSPGPIAPRHFLTLMPAALKTVSTSGSGRRELAEAIASPENPLTARVMVNRIWHHVFGRGIVASPDDFGRNGAAPSHPDLLDYLASEYMAHGWSTKRLLRLLLTSQAFQQTGYPVRRLEAEAVRDTLLSVSGRLDERLYGPSVQPYRAEPQEHRRLFAGPLDGDGRRSIYLKITRMEGPRFLEIFDFPNPLQTRGNRDVTNVPPQALAMLNDPFVRDQAQQWARRLVARKDDTPDARLNAMFLAAYGRPIHAQELVIWRDLLATFRAQQDNEESIWTEAAHTIFNAKEFLYLR
ncbi:MAG: PSD1 and planctomycete cytochrome C domain-containing protein [Bryobacteraceae bacterium]|nr:PSD1 and planctomycete cytochrome C domain-containing protein [Bryobacteraceae bacterium]